MIKLIDENGRLFGRINIVDFLIVSLIVVVTPLFIYIYKILGEMPTMVPQQRIKVEAITFVIPEFLNVLKEGDISYDDYGKEIGRILKISKGDSDRSNRLKSAIEKNINNPQYEYRIPVFIEFELWCSRGAEYESWYYRRQPLFINLNYGFDFNPANYSITCYALKIEDRYSNQNE